MVKSFSRSLYWRDESPNVGSSSAIRLALLLGDGVSRETLSDLVRVDFDP